MFLIKTDLKQGDALSPLFVNFALEFAIRWVHVNQEGLKLNGTHQFLVYADDVTVLGRCTHSIKKNTGVSIVASKAIGLEGNAEKTKCMVMSQNQNERQNHNLETDNKSFEMVGQP
jgi:hypothetical protein